MGQKGSEWTEDAVTSTEGDGFVFCGESNHSVDSKKRVFVPKRFQQGLPMDSQGSRVAVLTRGLDGCLYLFPEKGFNRAIQRLNTEAFAPKEALRLQRLIFSVSQRITLDGSGRLLLPAKLVAMAGISKDVVMVGVMDRIEIWSADRWTAFCQVEGGDEEAGFDELEQLLSGALGTDGGRS
ncbi:MAG: division/cell wall cluster transcriptional repressor MraZ [Planctomycetes bacterium]|nr:division/cell wall cluster transcriptional repressor MraZ [Planctomycetota bacterium]